MSSRPSPPAGELDRGAEQRVIGGALPDRGGDRPLPWRSRASSARAGRGRSAAGPAWRRAREERRPVDLGAVAWAWARAPSSASASGRPSRRVRDRGQPGVSSRRQAARHRAEHGVGAELQVGGRALLVEGLDRVGEAHRLAHVGDPVGGVGGLLGLSSSPLRLETIGIWGSCSRGSSRPLRTPPASAPSAASGRRGRRRGAWSCGPALPVGAELFDRLLFAGDDDGGRAVDRGDRELASLPAIDSLRPLPRSPRSRPSPRPRAGRPSGRRWRRSAWRRRRGRRRRRRGRRRSPRSSGRRAGRA